MTHMRIAPILNAAELMTHLEIQGCLDDSSSNGDIALASKRLLFHKKNASFTQGVSACCPPKPTLNHF